MSYTIDDIPAYAASTSARLITIVCAANGWTRQYFHDNFSAGGDAIVAQEYNRVAMKYGVAIALEEGA